MKLDPENFRNLVTEIGPLDDRILAVVELSEDTMLVVTGDAEVQIEYDKEVGAIILSVEVGRLPDEREASGHRFLLMYNSLLRETGGVVAALSGTGEVYLKALVPIVNLLPASLATIVVNMVGRAEAMMAGFQGDMGEQEPTYSPLNDESNFIRV